MLASIYLIVAETALWLFTTTTVSFFLPPIFSTICLAVLVFWRFGAQIITLPTRKDINLREIVRLWPHLYLLYSARVNNIDVWNTLSKNPIETIIVPVKEEIVYRFILPQVMMARFRNPSRFLKHMSVLMSSILFCYAHRNTFELLFLDMMVCFVSGIALGNRSQKKNFLSIMETTGIHALHNMHAITSANRGKRSGASHASPIAFYSTMIFADIWLDR